MTTLAATQSSTRLRSDLLVAAVLFALVFAAFGRTLTITTWVSDDVSFIVNNPAVYCGMPANTRQLAAAWWYPFEGLYIPVTFNLWWLISLASRLADGSVHPLPFHLANLLVHSLNSVLVFFIARRFARPMAAAAGAAIFAVHPIQTEAVSWASMMKDLLSGLFFFASILLYLRSKDGSDKRASYVASLVLAIFAILSKPASLVIGPCLALLEWLRGGMTLRQAAWKLLPFFLLAIPAAATTSKFQPAFEVWAPPLTLRPWVASYSMVHYLRELVWPAGLTADSGIHPLWIVTSSAGILATLILVAMLGSILLIPHRYRKLALCSLLLMVIGVAPMLGFRPFSYQLFSTVTDHYFYLSMLGAALLVGGIIDMAGSRLLQAALLVFIVTLSAASFLQTRYWQNTDAVVQRATAVNPDTLTYVDHCENDDERYALAARILLRYPTSDFACKLMERVCWDRGDRAGSLFYKQRIVERDVRYGLYLQEGGFSDEYDARGVADDCVSVVNSLIDAGRYERVAYFAEAANRLASDQKDVKAMNARLAELRQVGLLP